MSIHSFAEAWFAVFREETRLIELVDEVVEVVVGLEDDIPSATAVTAAGSSLGTVRLPEEGDATFAAMPGAGVNLDLVDKHKK
jgi:hypothetical protein